MMKRIEKMRVSDDALDLVYCCFAAYSALSGPKLDPKVPDR